MALRVLDQFDPMWADLSTMKTLTCVNHPTARYTTKNPWMRTIHLVNLADGLKRDCDCTMADLRLVVEQRRKPRPDPKAWDKALEIAQGNRNRLRLEPDGSVLVVNRG